MNKVCTQCLVEKPSTEYHKQTGTKDNLRYHCRACHTANAVKWGRSHKTNRARICAAWYERNPGASHHVLRLSQLRRLNRVPKWADLNKIKEIYINRPKGYEVDHIIPINGKTVSGFHVENNLQYLTISSNRLKRNKLDWVIK